MIGILICSINKDGLLDNCLDNLISKTNYKDYKIYLCVPPSIQKTIDIPNVVFIEREETEFYLFSKFVNRMVAKCEEEFICLLNDDTEVITSDWLSQMLHYAQKPEIGVVGAKLLYPDGTIQHVGGQLYPNGICGHIHIRERDRDNHNSAWNKTQYHSVVTAACSLMRKSVFQEVGGYEEQLVSYNDVDFCLKVMTAGYKNICVMESILIHYEGLTRGKEEEFLSRDQEYMKSKWGHLLDNDPYKEKK